MDFWCVKDVIQTGLTMKNSDSICDGRLKTSASYKQTNTNIGWFLVPRFFISHLLHSALLLFTLRTLTLYIPHSHLQRPQKTRRHRTRIYTPQITTTRKTHTTDKPRTNQTRNSHASSPILRVQVPLCSQQLGCKRFTLRVACDIPAGPRRDAYDTQNWENYTVQKVSTRFFLSWGFKSLLAVSSWDARNLRSGFTAERVRNTVEPLVKSYRDPS